MITSTRIKNLEKRVNKNRNSKSIQERIDFNLFLQGLPVEVRTKYAINNNPTITLQEWEAYKSEKLTSGMIETELKAMEDKIREVGGFMEIIFIREDGTQISGDYIY